MSDKILAYWYKPAKNFGDWLTPYLIKKLSGHDATYVDSNFYPLKGQYIYFCVGSILEKATPKTIVWGSGLMFKKVPDINPYEICAVRGPLTRHLLLNAEVDCPKTYGDPALLLPRFYTPKVEKKYKLGIIPHFIDKGHSWLQKAENRDDVLIIDICGEVEDVIDNICSCEAIASSCLHGLVVADAYRIPSVWIEFSNKVLGEGFKFRDYYASIHEKSNTVLKIKDDIEVDDLYDRTWKKSLDIDLDKLLKACPFYEVKK